MAVELLTLIPNEETRRLNFFNGRLLSGDDLTAEQHSHRAMHELLGRAVGDGVVRGLEVALVEEASTPAVPVLRVASGYALNRRGEALVLDDDVDARLTVQPPPRPSAAGPPVFSECTPPQETAYLTNTGIYVLTLCSKQTGEGMTPFGGLTDLPRRCNMRWIVDAVTFRLVPLQATPALLANLSLARNLVAYECLGALLRQQWAADPTARAPLPRPLLEQSRDLTDCDVPLAILYWTQAEGMRFIDMWAVRRRCAAGGIDPDDAVWSSRALAISEAMQRQFDDHLRDIERIALDPETVEARSHFRFLPPAGILPLTTGVLRHFTAEAFFRGATVHQPLYLEAGDVQAVFRAAVDAPPIDLTSPHFLWLYFVRANRQTRAHGGAGVPRHYVLFAAGDVPFFANSRFNRSHFDYSNFV